MTGVEAACLWHLLGTKARTATCVSSPVDKALLAFACGSGPGSAESGVGRCVERRVLLRGGILLSY